jgi:hypothetical protein
VHYNLQLSNYLVELVHLLLTDVEVGHLELVCSLESVAAADAQEVVCLAQLQQRAAQALLVLEGPADVDGGCLAFSLWQRKYMRNTL